MITVDLITERERSMGVLDDEVFDYFEDHDCKGEECNNPVHPQI